MLSLGSPESYISPHVHRFAGVELDVERLQLRVDGQPTACPRKAFELLLLLCSAPETVLPRQQLLDVLWPGGQVISDEALTQVIFRARAALGPYAGLLATVRGIGVRLDAKVTSIDSKARQLSPPPSASQVVEVTQPNPRKSRFLLLLPVLLLAAVATYFLGFMEKDPEILDAGYALTSDDILNSQPETAAMLVEAFASEATGERARAITVLEAVHRNDESTPIPALFLALWRNGTGESEVATEWLDQARTRVGDHTALYPNLLLDYIAAEVGGVPDQIINKAGALLDLRPAAWRMHHARAHLMEYSGMREAALREISQIQVDGLGERKLALTIADRASMGDVEGAQAILERLSPVQDPAMHSFLSGRVAWSRGDFKVAHGFFVTAAELGYDRARMDIYRRCLIYAGALEALFGEDEQALTTLERARSVAGNRSQIDEADVAMFMAQLHFSAGHMAQAYAELDRSLAVSPDLLTDEIGIVSRMLAMRMRPDIPLDKPEGLLPDSDALWNAARAVVRDDPVTAKQALAEALNLGVLDSRLADEARWLQWQLGLPVSDESVIDPPYPPLSRIMLRREIRQAMAATGVDPGPLRP